MSRTPRVRALGIALRQARTENQVTLRQLGERIGRNSGEISRWENGERPLTPDRVAQILTALAIYGDRYDKIIELSYEAKNPPWVATRVPERDQQMSALIDFERTATQITDVAPLLVPGLLQEADYIEAIMRGGDGIPLSEVPTRVTIRLGRRHTITRARPVRYVALLGEAVLHQMVGDEGVMTSQMRHLIELNRQSNIDIRILPYGSGWHPGLEGAFSLIQSAYGTPIVQLENRRSTLFLHEEDDVAAYRRVVEQLKAVALNEERTLKLMTGVLARWEKVQ